MTNALIIATFSGSLFRKLISNIEIDSWFYSSHQFYSNVIWPGIMRYYLFSGRFFPPPKSGNWTKAWIIHFAKFHRWNNNIIQYLSQSRIYKLTKPHFSVSRAALSTKSMYFYSLLSKGKQKKCDAAIPGEVWPYIHSQPSRTNMPEIWLSSWSMQKWSRWALQTSHYFHWKLLH